MKKSKKIAIILAISATFGGVLSSPPERTYAADIVIDSKEEFNALGDDAAWVIRDDNISPSASLSGNTIIFKNITSSKSLIAGFGSNGEGDTNNNTIVVINSTVDTSKLPSAGSGGDHIIGGFTGNEYNDYNANNNKVIIVDSKIKAHIFGGDSHYGSAVGNTVVVDNSEIDSGYIIYGGYAYVPQNEDGKYDDVVSGNASNNTIIIKNNSKLDGVRIYGGYLSLTGKENIANLTEANFKKVNNTVTFDNWHGNVEAVRSADNVNFYNVSLQDFVAKEGAEPTDAILTITGNANSNNSNNFENIIGRDDKQITGADGTATKDINIGVSFQGGQDIKANETIRLVKMTGGATVDTSNDDEGNKKIKLANDGTAYAGVAQVLKGELDVEKEYIDYTIKSVGLNDQVNVVNEGRAASAAFLNQSDELISEALAGLNLEDKYGFETFAMVYGNDSRYGTNSDLSINGWSGLVGVGSNNKTKAGDFAWAAFFENGAGNYDISTTMNGITMEGDGSTVYNGGGIAARLTGENGVYGEASLRAGLLKNDLEHGLQNQNGEAFGYESESNYYGMHIGIGKIFKLENGASVDTYAKYYHSTVKDDSFTIDSDEFEMDDINSDRLRLGIRYNQGMDRTFNVYYGAAWEYEFNGESNGYAQGHKMEETSLKGSTVIGELGVVIQPENSPWSFDAKVKGYGGQRDGYSGSILATYHF